MSTFQPSPDYQPLRPPYTLYTPLATFNDAVEHLLDQAGVTRGGRNDRIARRAVLEAYRDLPNDKKWPYFYRRSTVTTEASVSTGTVQYLQSSGISGPRELTLTGATWPVDALFWTVRMDGGNGPVNYEIEARISDTVVRLDVRNNPGVDLAAGTSYEAYRDNFPLPVDFMKAGRIIDVSAVNRVLTYVAPDEYLERNRGYVATNWPWYYTCMQSPRYEGTMAIFFGQPPNTARTYDFIYERRPRDLKIELYKTGTATVVANATTVTIAGGAISNWHVGSVLRISENNQVPTSVIGSLEGDNPFVVQRIIQNVNVGSQQITVDTPVATALSGVGYAISDPIDLQLGAMLSYFYRLAEYRFAVLSNRDDAQQKFMAAETALRDAAAADNRTFDTEGQSIYSGRLRDLAQQINLGFVPGN